MKTLREFLHHWCVANPEFETWMFVQEALKEVEDKNAASPRVTLAYAKKRGDIVSVGRGKWKSMIWDSESFPPLRKGT